MNKIRTAIIGVGYLGKFHAQKYAELPQAELVAVCDSNYSRAEEIAAQYHTKAFANYEEIVDLIDAVSIVTPTPLHHQIGLFFLEHGKHVLLEKPIATSIEQAEELIRAAKKNHVILQIGHLERFNNVIKALEPVIKQPMFIESLRLAPFKLRGSDVNVVLDLMIHDIDIIQSIVKSEIRAIHANGAPIISPYIDIANARIEFENGCVANVTASRVSLKQERKLRIFQPDCYVGVDLESKNLSLHRKGTQEMFPGIPEIITENHAFDKGDTLKAQIISFLDCIANDKKPIVSGEDGKKALHTAIQITEIVRKQIEHFVAHHA